MTGGIGDLVNLFPTLERLAARAPLDMGTGGYPYRALVEANPHVAAVWSPFVYKPIRRAHRRLIQRVLRPLYREVILLDNYDSRWWARGQHMSALHAAACGVPPPSQGRIYLTAEHRAAAARYLDEAGIRDFVYVAQVIRRRRAFRSWPLSHYNALYAGLRAQGSWTVVGDTTGSDETELPRTCHRLGRLDILTAAAVIERARLFIGPDSGLTHVAAALGTPTVSIHLGYPPESCRALGDSVTLVEQREPFDDPSATAPSAVLAAVEKRLHA